MRRAKNYRTSRVTLYRACGTIANRAIAAMERNQRSENILPELAREARFIALAMMFARAKIKRTQLGMRPTWN